MTTTCQVWDSLTSTILLDLNDATGANASDTGYTSTQLLQTVDLGSPQWEFDRFSPPQRDGGATTFKRAGFRVVNIPFRMRAASYDNLAMAMGRLSQFITTGCVIRWRADGSSNYRYIDVEPSPNPYFLDGRELSLYLATTLVDTPSGVTLQLTCQPYLRGDELDSASNKLTNATLLRDAEGTGTPDGWVWVATTGITAQNIDVAAEAFEFTIADATARNLQQSTAAATAASGDIWTLSMYARSVSATAKVQPVIRYNSSAPADLGSDFAGTLTTLTTGWQRISVTTTAAPATTDRVKVSLRVDNDDATSRDIQFKNVKLEEAAAATAFTVGNEVGSADPEPALGMGQVFPIYNPGDAPAPVELVYSNPATVLQSYVGAAANSGAVPGSGQLVTMLNSGVTILQFEDWTNGTDTAANSSADSSPGTGTTGKKTTFVSTSELLRLSAAITADIDVLRGRTFMPVLRIAAADATYTGDIHLNYAWSTNVAVNEMAPVTFTALVTGATYSYVPLSLLSVPDVALDAMTLSFYANRASGTGNLIWDALILVPTDLGFTWISNGAAGTATDLIVTDPDNGRVYTATAAGLYRNSPVVEGPIPLVAPPGLSLVYAMAGLQGTTTSHTALRAPRTNTLSMRSVFSPRYYA